MKKLLILPILLLLAFPVKGQQGSSDTDSAGVYISLFDQLHLDTTNTKQFATIYIPEWFDTSKGINLWLHLHGAGFVPQNILKEVKWNTILCTIHLGPFSGYYSRNHFAYEGKIDSTFDIIKDNIRSYYSLPANSEIDNFIVSAFSAGYGGVREFLKLEHIKKQIDAIILADGLHTDSEIEIRNKQMEPFLNYAQDAAEGKKVFVISHSSIEPDGYESTTETTDYLISELGLEPVLLDETDPIGNVIRVVERGGFVIRGYTGKDGEAHMKHFYEMKLLLNQTLSLLRDNK